MQATVPRLHIKTRGAYTMRVFLIVLGVLVSILSLIAFIVGMASRDGTDFHLMTAGVFLTVSAVSFGCAGIVYRLDLIHEALSAKPTPTATVDETEAWVPKALRDQS